MRLVVSGGGACVPRTPPRQNSWHTLVAGGKNFSIKSVWEGAQVNLNNTLKTVVLSNNMTLMEECYNFWYYDDNDIKFCG